MPRLFLAKVKFCWHCGGSAHTDAALCPNCGTKFDVTPSYKISKLPNKDYIGAIVGMSIGLIVCATIIELLEAQMQPTTIIGYAERGLVTLTCIITGGLAGYRLSKSSPSFN